MPTPPMAPPRAAPPRAAPPIVEPPTPTPMDPPIGLDGLKEVTLVLMIAPCGGLTDLTTDDVMAPPPTTLPPIPLETVQAGGCLGV